MQASWAGKLSHIEAWCEMAQEFDLAENALRVDDAVERMGDLLDRHLLSRLGVLSRYHHTIRTMSNRLDQCVLVILG
jgi:hypothetical protein